MKKHGIDFVKAQEIWEDPNLVERHARMGKERRYAVVGSIEGDLWTAIITYRGGLIRIISVRRARKNEKKVYHSQ